MIETYSKYSRRFWDPKSLKKGWSWGSEVANESWPGVGQKRADWCWILSQFLPLPSNESQVAPNSPLQCMSEKVSIKPKKGLNRDSDFSSFEIKFQPCFTAVKHIVVFDRKGLKKMMGFPYPQQLVCFQPWSLHTAYKLQGTSKQALKAFGVILSGFFRPSSNWFSMERSLFLYRFIVDAKDFSFQALALSFSLLFDEWASLQYIDRKPLSWMTKCFYTCTFWHLNTCCWGIRWIQLGMLVPSTWHQDFCCWCEFKTSQFFELIPLPFWTVEILIRIGLALAYFPQKRCRIWSFNSLTWFFWEQ